MKQVRDLNKKRIFDMSDDGKTIMIRQGDCVTIIKVRDDRTLEFHFERLANK